MITDGDIGIEEGMKSNRKGKLQVKIINNNSNNHFWIKNVYSIKIHDNISTEVGGNVKFRVKVFKYLCTVWEVMEVQIYNRLQ